MDADFRGRRRVGRSYNGWVKALERQGSHVLPLVKSSLREHARERLHRIPDTAGWTLLAVDGSKEELPRTRDHERVFGIADNGISPQAFVTCIVEVRTGLPWDWRIGEARSGEKLHFLEMIPGLPDDALLLGDGAFVGFPIWSLLDRQNKRFLIRVGGNVHLITRLWPGLRVRIEDQTVWVWPQRIQEDEAPLKLRLIRVGRGAKAVYLVTNVLEPTRLPRKAAGEIYRLRWGVELFYRALKRTFGFVKLRSKAARRARMEMEWGLIAMTIATLIGVDALLRRRINPDRLSPAQLLNVLRTSLRHSSSPKSPVQRLPSLYRDVAMCLKDRYRRRSKKSRARRRTTNTPVHLLSPPILRPATPSERQLAISLANKNAA